MRILVPSGITFFSTLPIITDWNTFYFRIGQNLFHHMCSLATFPHQELVFISLCLESGSTLKLLDQENMVVVLLYWFQVLAGLIASTSCFSDHGLLECSHHSIRNPCDMERLCIGNLFYSLNLT